MKVYIAGPYTHPDPVENTHNAIKAADALVELGMIPYIPHLSMTWHLVSPRADVNFWYAYDLHWLRVCDAVLRLPGASTGADAEVAEAERCDIPVYYSAEEIAADLRAAKGGSDG